MWGILFACLLGAIVVVRIWLAFPRKHQPRPKDRFIEDGYYDYDDHGLFL